MLTRYWPDARCGHGRDLQWEQAVDVNCKGVLNGIGAVLADMLSRGQGHIVNTSSDAGRKVFAGLSVYSASKFFVEAVSQVSDPAGWLTDKWTPRLLGHWFVGLLVFRPPGCSIC